MTIPLDDGTPAGVLDIATHFYEFIPEQEVDAPRPTVLLAHQLKEGESYFIVLTTSSGLYRYHISDVVRCVGHWGQAPLLEFLHKGSHFCNLAGEKLTEFHVAEAVRRALEDLDMEIGEYTLAPCWDEPPYYALLLEAGDVAAPGQAQNLVRRVERHLNALNIEYQSKRQSLAARRFRLARSRPARGARSTSSAAARQAAGSEQYKHPCLVSDLEFVQKMTATRADGAARSGCIRARSISEECEANPA